MANETLQTTGAYAVAQVATSTLTLALCTGAVTKVGTAITTEKLYPLLDLKISVGSTVTTAGDTISVYRRPSDGTNQSPPIVVADFANNYVGSVVLDNLTATQYYYIYGVANPDDEDEYYLVNDSGDTLIIGLTIRGRTYGTA